ncbi:MAG: APC family permease [Pseudomonadota bacterium]
MSDAVTRPKTLRQRDAVLFTVSAILLPETIASVASTGASSISWWFLLALFFMIPVAMISSELGCAYPEQGGVYAWVRDAFGGRWASRITWCYWSNVSLWLASIYVIFAGIASQLFGVERTLGLQLSIAIGITWLTVLTNIITLEFGKWVPNVGGIVKVLLFLGIILGAANYVSQNEMANPLTVRSLAPELNESLKYLPVIVYGMLGFELVCASSDEMQNPQRDVPQATFYSGLIVFVLYVGATIAMLAAQPAEQINLVEGLVDTLRLFFADFSLGPYLVMALGLGTLFALFSSGVCWALGSNRAAAEAAGEGELPSWFATESRATGTPVGAAVMMGLITTGALLIYGLTAGSNEDLFWTLFAFSSVLFFLPYLGMVLAFFRLRFHDAEHSRPYRVPGGQIGASVATACCCVVLSTAIVLLMYTPGEGASWSVVLGVLCSLLVGEVLIRVAERKRGDGT